MAEWNFFSNVRSNIVKWWRLVILPVFHLNNNNPQTVARQLNENKQVKQAGVACDAADCKDTGLLKKKEGKAAFAKASEDNSDTWWGEAMQNQTEGDKDELFSTDRYKAAPDNKDALEILNRLNRERQEAEAQKQREIEEARRKAQEQERINSILDANKVNVDEFIEEGMAGRRNTENLKSEDSGLKVTEDEKEHKRICDEEAKREEDMQRAQEIIDRLNREAAEDEAKKIAEIEELKEKARKQFGR